MNNLTKKYFPMILGLLIVTSALTVQAQGDIPWLADFTDEMVVGNETYQYAFTTVEGNECKVEFKEYLTDRKGEKKSRSWVFYLSDLDPDALQFKARGKAISVTLETVRSQKFVSAFEGDEFDEYTEVMVLTMNEVDQARGLIEAIRENIGACRETETTWTDREEALDWLTAHIGDAKDDDVKWEQQISTGEAPHLVTFTAKSTDQKGEEESSEYLFNLMDIDPLNVELVVAGRSLHVDLTAKNKKRYIQNTTPEGIEYIQSLRIYSDDIEEARMIVQALGYAASNFEAARPVWEDYNQALEYIKAHQEEVNIGGDVYSLNLEYDLFASDILNLQVSLEEADGERKETIYSFYPADMTETLQLEVDRDEVIVHMETRGERDFVRKSSGGSVTGYDSDIEFHAAGIDEARNLISAWEYIFKNSEEELETFGSVDEVNTWMGNNFPALYRDGTTFEQVLSVNGEMNNQITFEIAETEEGSEKTENRYVLYPEDIDPEALEIQVRFGKLSVSLETGRDDYIRHYENGVVQNFTDNFDIYFFDPLVAKNFMEAIRFLISDVTQPETPEMGRQDLMDFLSGNMPGIELSDATHEQQLEVLDPENCKLKFTRVETEKDKEAEEFVYEFMAPDLSESDSNLSVKGNLIGINLETSGNRDLVKPFEDGEVQDFTDGFTIYADDVLQARRILKAFGLLSKICE